MKNHGICTKCASTEIARVPGKALGHNRLPVGSGSAAVDRWVCCACGYSEEWIREADLKKVKEWW